MPFQRLGLTAVYSVDEKPFVKGTKKARDALGRFISKVEPAPTRIGRLGQALTRAGRSAQMSGILIGRGLNRMSGGMQSLAMSALPMTIGLGFAVKSAANFEHQMSAVGAVSGASSEEMATLNKEAQRMGIVSAFSATQSAEGMELLARAGAKPVEIIQGLSGVMNAAAADSIDMATAADIVAQSVKINELGFGQASHVADVLAQASASANTDMVSLGEAMKMAGGKAHSMGMTYEDTVGTLAKFADAGLRGSLGGTALTNMLVKLTKPTAKTTALFKKFKIELTKDGKMRRVPEILGDVNMALSKIGDDAKRAAMAAEVFGIRGERGYTAFATSGKESLNEYIKTLEASSDAVDKNGNKIGAAQLMAERRLDNLKGQFTLLGSSFEGLAIKLFGPFTGPLTELVTMVKDGLNGVLEAFALLNEGTSMDKVEKKFGKLAWIAQGFQWAINEIKYRFSLVAEAVSKFGEKFKGALDGPQIARLVKIATIAGLAIAAMAPLLLSFIGLKFAIGGVISIVSGMATVLSAAFWPVLAVIAAVGIAYSFLKRDNESLLETATRVFGTIKEWVLDVYYNAVLPFINGIRSLWIPIVEDLGNTWNGVITQIKELFNELFGSFTSVAGGMAVNWKLVGQIFATVFSSILKVAMYVIEGIVRLFKYLMVPVKAVLQFVHNIAAALGTMFGGSVLEGFKRLGMALLDFILTPIKMVLKGILELAEMTGAINLVPSHIAKGIKDFTNNGLTDSFFPKDTGGGGVPVAPKVQKAATKAGGLAASSVSDDMAKKAGGKMTAEAMAEAVKNGTKEGQKDQCLEATINNQVAVDGDALNLASSKSKVRTKERSGGKMTPWQYRSILESGSAGV